MKNSEINYVIRSIKFFLAIDMENKLHNKLILGSANLEQKYGINKNEIKIKEFKKIINFLLKRRKRLFRYFFRI